MTGDLIPANVLATHTIANVSETLAEKLGLPRQYRSIGIITADSDDVTYCALDEATKAAAVDQRMPAVQYADMRNHHFDFPTGTVLSAGLYIDHTRGKTQPNF